MDLTKEKRGRRSYEKQDLGSMPERLVLLSFVHGSCTMKSLLWQRRDSRVAKLSSKGLMGIALVLSLVTATLVYNFCGKA